VNLGEGGLVENDYFTANGHEWTPREAIQLYSCQFVLYTGCQK